VLLEMDFGHRPQLDVTAACQSPEFFYGRLECWVGLGHLWAGLAQPKPKAPKPTLTLSGT
jgi:hypothetical protein